MNELHLQSLDGPLLLFGGPYGNLQATQALKKHAEQLGIPPFNAICTGDVVAYCAQPNETIELLRTWGVHVLMGNCEESLGAGIDDCGCGFAPGTSCDLLSDEWYRYTNNTVVPQHREWMQSLPRTITFSYNGKRFVVVHGSVTKINEFVFDSTPSMLKARQIELAQADGVIGGHCGLPFTNVVHGKLWHNPGVIGMPANDGTRRGWYSIWRHGHDQIHIQHRYLDYDVESAYAAIQRAGLNNGYADGLLSGRWPSMDLLPDEERQRQGQPLDWDKRDITF